MEETEVKPLTGCSLAYERNGERHDKTNAVLFPDSIASSIPGFEILSSLKGADIRAFIQGRTDGRIT